MNTKTFSSEQWVARLRWWCKWTFDFISDFCARWNWKWHIFQKISLSQVVLNVTLKEISHGYFFPFIIHEKKIDLKNCHISSRKKKKKLFIIRESSCRRTLPTSDEAGSACRIHTGRRHSGKFTTYQYSSWVDFSSYFISIKSTLGSLNGLWGFISARAGLEFSKI